MEPNLERRRGPDFWSRAVRWITIAGWLILLAGLWAFERARPEPESFFHRLYEQRYGMETALRENWDTALLEWVSPLVLLALAIGLVSVVIGLFRSRRRGDPLRIWSFLLVIAACGGLLAWLVTVAG